MKLNFLQSAHQLIVYDADCIQRPEADWFDAEYWRREKAIERVAPGRGSALMLDTPFGKAVLRTCLRGGWMKHLSRDRYLFTGYGRSRPVVEVSLLARLWNLGLPVPQPLAGMCRKSGLAYSGALLTRRIEPATTLADVLAAGRQGEIGWFEAGQCVRRFHDAGVVHPDLNARNILFGAASGVEGDVYLVDFDRAVVRKGATPSFAANLARLQRSLRKFCPETQAKELTACWQEFKAGYNTAK